MTDKALEFILEKRGWIKKRPADLQERLERNDIILSIDEVREVQSKARRQIKEPISDASIAEAIPENMSVRRIWVTPNGGTGVSYEKKKDSETSFEQIEDSIRDLLESIAPVKTKRNAPSLNGRMLSVFSTDKHIGAHTASNSMYENVYNAQEVYNRHDRLIEKINDQAGIFGKFKILAFYDLGDPVDGAGGQTTRGGHGLPQNMDDREQIDTFIKVTIDTIEQLIADDIAEEIWFIATTNDNHAGSFGHGAVRAIQMYLEAKYPDVVKTKVSVQLLDHITFGDHTYIFGHGKDDSDMKSGMPLNLDLKTENFINDYIDRKKIRSPHIHLVKGDLHQSSVNYAKRFRYKNNMSMYGASKWIHTNFGSGDSGVDLEITDLNSEEIHETRITFGRDS